jgi:dephospho-CoA kinase
VESTRGYEYAGVIVVEAPLTVRLDRLVTRGVDRDDAERRIALQATDAQRRAVATWVLDNSGSPAMLERQVDEIWHEVRAKALQDDASSEPARE